MITEDTLLFTVGPVEMEDEIKEVGGVQLPYFRTKEFSALMLEIEKTTKRLIKSSEKSKVLVLTASGSGAMEAAVINVFDSSSKVLVINGGSFGHRFEDICRVYEIPYEVIALDAGKKLTEEKLNEYKGKGFTGLLINAHETSTGVLYDMEMVGNFCKNEKILLVVDSISSFLADNYEMEKWGIDISILSSQKALALAPGLSLVVVNEKAIEIINKNNVKSLYFDLKDYLKNMDRGQTPFTPAVGIILQLAKKLEMIEKEGLESLRIKIENLAKDFREKIKNLPLEKFSESESNAVTALKPITMSANEIYEKLRYDYNITVLPSGGKLKDIMFRVGHLGNLTPEDNDKLVNAMKEILKK